MIEHCINHDLKAHVMSLFHQCGKFLIGTECRIKLFVISGIVTVIGSAPEYRIKVNAGNTEGGQILKSFGHAPDVASVETLMVDTGNDVPVPESAFTAVLRP